MLTGWTAVVHWAQARYDSTLLWRAACGFSTRVGTPKSGKISALSREAVLAPCQRALRQPAAGLSFHMEIGEPGLCHSPRAIISGRASTHWVPDCYGYTPALMGARTA